MKCISCKEDVPPKFTHAIAVNICPLCGQEIMAAKLQSILVELKSLLTEAKEYPDEVEDWMFSNFSFKKISPDEIILNKNQITHQQHQQSERQTSPEAQALLEGKGKITVRRNEDVVAEDFAKRAGVHKQAVEFIKGKASFGAADPSEFVGVDDEYGDVFVEENTQSNANPLNTVEQNQMNQMFNTGSDPAAASRELQMQKLKRLQSQQAFEGGGGKFRRG